MIECSGIYKSYRNSSSQLDVLKEINLKVAQNEFVAITGPSGAGKSTLLHLLGGLDQPSAGKINFCGLDLYGLSDNERSAIRNRRMGFVFQFFHLLPELDVLENVLLPALIKTWWQRRVAGEYARQLLDKLGLSSRITHRPNQLSGGEQQRVAIARALINKPQVLFCDEPTGNLDSENGRRILELIGDLRVQHNMAVLLVTHDRDIAACAERVIHLKDGLILH